MHSKNFFLMAGGVTILVLTIIVLVYRHNSQSDIVSTPVDTRATATNTPNTPNTPSTSNISPAVNTQTSTPKVTPGSLDKSLSADEIALLYTPTGIQTPVSEKAHFDLAQKLAIGGGKITVTDCTAKPAVLLAKIDDTITISNEGIQSFHFGFDADKILVSPGKSISYKVNFKTGQGLYGYGCDDPSVSRAIGLILVTKTQ